MMNPNPTKTAGAAAFEALHPGKDFAGFQHALEAVAEYLPPELAAMLDAELLFKQLNPRFLEGSFPLTTDARGDVIDALAKLVLGLDPKSRYKFAMDGFGQHAGGLIVLNEDDNYAHVLAIKGDPYNKGKIGVLGGQGSDKDQGDDLKSALREGGGEELGNYPFDPARLIYLTTTYEWRTTDSRGHYWIKASFYVYIARGSEVTDIHRCYDRHVKATGGDPEIQSIRSFKRREVLELIRDGRMGYFDQTQAFVMTGLCLRELGKAKVALAAIGNITPTEREVWQVAAALVGEEFRSLTDLSQGDWRPKINPDQFL